MTKFSPIKAAALAAATLTASALAATPVMAQDTEDAEETEEASGPITITGGVTLVSDYRFRGISFSNEKVAVQPELTVEHESGFYVGVWGSNITDSDAFGDTEVDLIAGFGTEIAPGTTLDANITYFWYPDGKKFAGPVDYFETAVGLTHTLGPVEISGLVAYAWDQEALGNNDSIYLSGGLAYGIPDSPVTLVSSVGYTNGSLSPVTKSYWDWSAGADFAAGPFTLGVRYIDSDVQKTGVKADDTQSDATVVVSLGLGF